MHSSISEEYEVRLKEAESIRLNLDDFANNFASVARKWSGENMIRALTKLEKVLKTGIENQERKGFRIPGMTPEGPPVTVAIVPLKDSVFEINMDGKVWPPEAMAGDRIPIEMPAKSIFVYIAELQAAIRSGEFAKVGTTVEAALFMYIDEKYQKEKAQS